MNPVAPKRVIGLVADYYHVDCGELVGPSRAKHLTTARKVAYRLVHDRCGMSWPTVGMLFQRDHTTCLRGAMHCDELVAKLIGSML